MAARSSQRCASSLARAPTFINLLAVGRPALRPSRTLVQSIPATASTRPRYFSSNTESSPLPAANSNSDAPKVDAPLENVEQDGLSERANEEWSEDSEPSESKATPVDGVEVDAPTTEADAAAPAPTSTSSSTPWYLDVEPPRHPTLVPHQAPLPATPEDSPSLTEPLIKFVGEELGLDDLNLLDLRSLDPPPALGPKLIMLFGTARSERHLHVSADRLVRWLRKHGATAHADGLLGRNELKIKMRRRARRAKLVGDSSFDRGDDGISTGWICVNLGTLGWNLDPTAETTLVDDQGRPSGFGQPISGTTIVVQMLTEAKREDLGLERLWGGVLKKSNRDREAIEPHDNTGALTGALKSPEKPRKRRPGQFPDFDPAQPRSYSTAVRVRDSMPLEELFKTDRAAFSHELSYSPQRKLELMNKIRAFADEAPVRDAQYAAKLSSLVNIAVSGLPPADTWSFRSFITSHTMQIRAVSDDAFAEMRQLVSEAQMVGIPIARDDALRILRSIFATPEIKSKDGDDGPAPTFLHERAELAAELLQTMHERGMPVLANDVITSLQSGLAGPVAHDRTKPRTDNTLVDGQQQEGPTPATPRALRDGLEDLRALSGLPCPPEAEIQALMGARSAAGDFAGFWEAWRLPGRHGAPRSPDLYWWLFRHTADLGRPDVALEALRTAVPQALAEAPEPVRFTGTLGGAVWDCMAVLDPRARQRRVPEIDAAAESRPDAEILRMMRMLAL
ncbi:hypothetical protein RB597_007712 [Gaeumannomyces tritici]